MKLLNCYIVKLLFYFHPLEKGDPAQYSTSGFPFSRECHYGLFSAPPTLGVPGGVTGPADCATPSVISFKKLFMVGGGCPGPCNFAAICPKPGIGTSNKYNINTKGMRPKEIKYPTTLPIIGIIRESKPPIVTAKIIQAMIM